MKRKILLLTVTLTMSLVMAFSLIGCGLKPADTFYTGAISAEEFDTKEDAAEAFVMSEINGEATNAKFVSYAKEADLTQKEIEKLDLPAEEKQNIESAEKGNVKYSVQSEGGVYASADEEKLYLVIIITYKNKKVRYYSPVINTGDVLTKSYYDKVFAKENFKNVTVNYGLEYSVKMTVKGETTKIKMSVNIEALLNSDTYSYIKASTSMDEGGGLIGGIIGSITGGSSGDSVKYTTEDFIVNDPSSPYYNCRYSKKDSSVGGTKNWTMIRMPDSDEDSESGIPDSGMSEYGDKLLPSFDYSYFIKTKSGFSINEEKLGEYLKIALNDTMSGMGSMIDAIDLSDVKASADYYVNDGKIQGSEFSLGIKYSGFIYGEKVSYDIKETLETEYSDYGSTVVTVPEGLDLSRITA